MIHPRPVRRVKASKDLRVRDIMTGQPMTVAATANLADAVDMMERASLRHLPVVDAGGQLVAILSERNVRDALPSVLTVHDQVGRRKFLAAAKVSDVAADHPSTISPDATVVEAIDEMRRLRVGSLPVVDRRKLVGIVTSGDLADVLQQILKDAI